MYYHPDCANELAARLISVKDKSQLKELLSDILTEKELMHIVMRLEIVELLKRGATMREIAVELEVSTSTVIASNRILQRGKYNLASKNI